MSNAIEWEVEREGEERGREGGREVGREEERWGGSERERGGEERMCS